MSAFATDSFRYLPRIPLVEREGDLWEFSRAGRKLADLHLNYENPRKVEGVTIEVTGEGKLNDLDPENFRVEKMYFAKNGKEEDRTTLYYNSQVTIKNIPLKAYDYQVNGKSPIDWMIEFYCANAQTRSLKKTESSMMPMLGE